MTEKKFSPGILRTNHNEYRLLASRPITRSDDDFDWDEYAVTFLATPKLSTNEVHVPGRLITVNGDWEIDWYPHWIEVAIPIENDPQWREVVEDVYTDEEPVVELDDFVHPEMDCGV